MTQPVDSVVPTLPGGIDPSAVLTFRADLGSPHPVRTADARLAGLTSLRVPEDLIGRLRRWSAHFAANFTQADGWKLNTPAAWWLAERDALPRDTAALFGPETAVRVVGGYLHSTEPPRSEEAAAALKRTASKIAGPVISDGASDPSSFAYIAGTGPATRGETREQ